MQAETDTDRLAYLQILGETATLTVSGGSPTTISVIFDREFEEVAGGTVDFASSNPFVQCRTVAVSAVSPGDVLTVQSTDFAVEVRMDDGTGMTTLQLSEA